MSALRLWWRSRVCRNAHHVEHGRKGRVIYGLCLNGWCEPCPPPPKETP